MLVEFSLGNYRSFLPPQTLSFRATPLDGISPEMNVLDVDNDYRLLKIVGIYGPNASGKSNLIRGGSILLENAFNADDVAPHTQNPCTKVHLLVQALLDAQQD